MDILQNSSFMFFFIITFILFLILYMWRKVASLESYVFILEKRINNIKKDISIINTNNGISSKDDEICSTESVSCKFSCIDKKCSNDETKCYLNDIIMNEVFGGCKKPQVSFQTIDLPVANSAGENINIEYEDSIKVDEEIDNVLNTVLDVKKPKSPLNLDSDISLSTLSSLQTPIDISSSVNNVNTNSTIMTDTKKGENKKNEKISETQEKKEEECSETTLNKKKLKIMPIDTLKQLCIANNLSPDGTKNILIDRLSAL